MNSIKINNTPVRTSRNYNINNILINGFVFPSNNEFNNFNFKDFDSDNLKITNAVSDFKLTYGTGEILENQVKEHANCKIRIEILNSSDKENILNFIFDANNRCLINCIEIIANENIKANVTIRLANEYTDNDVESFYNGIITANLMKNSEVNLTFVNLLSGNAKSFISIENEIDSGAKLNYSIVDFGGSLSVSNYFVNLKGKESYNKVNTIYLGSSDEVIDMNYIAHVKGEKSRVFMDAQGAIKDKSKKHFKGTIDFKRGSKKSEGAENEFCMLLSDTAKSISLPMLLCDEEDVSGNHSAASGKADNKELFYLMSRGFNEQEAKTLLVYAKFNKVIENITNEELRKEILFEINKRLGSESFLFNN